MQETFELRDNDIMMRDLSSTETEAVGGAGFATVTAFTSSGTGSFVGTFGGFSLFSNNTFGSASIHMSTSQIGGVNNQIGVSARAGG